MKPSYIPHLKNETMTDLKRSEKSRKLAISKLENRLRIEKVRLEDIVKEINYRNSPKAQEMHKNLKRMKTMMENHENGKKPLSSIKHKHLIRAIKLTETALNIALLCGNNDIIQEKPTRNLKCEKCGSSRLYYRKITKDHRCKICGATYPKTNGV